MFAAVTCQHRANATSVTVAQHSTIVVTTAGEEASGDGHLVAQHLLLDFLADRQQQKDLALSATARSFLTCRLFADELTALRATAGDAKQQQSQLLARYRSTSQQFDNGCRSEMGAGARPFALPCRLECCFWHCIWCCSKVQQMCCWHLHACCIDQGTQQNGMLPQ